MLKRTHYVRRGDPARPPTPDSARRQAAEVARERAARGARVLDEEVPGWADVIDLDALDVGEMEVYDRAGLAEGGGCVLCQVDLAITTGTPTAAGCRIPRPGQTTEDLLAEEEFYAEQRRLVADEGPDAADDEGNPVQGSYKRLADDLGLVTAASKTEHGFLADAGTTYPALDAAWTAEITARRVGGPDDEAAQ